MNHIRTIRSSGAHSDTTARAVATSRKSSKSLIMNSPAGIASPYRQSVPNRLSSSNASARCRRLSTAGYHNFILATSKDTIVDNTSAPGI